MATTQRQAVTSSDRQLCDLLARREQLSVAIARRAAEVVRTWLLDHDRTWVAVDFTKTRPEPPFDGEGDLAAAVAELPRRAYGSGLDVRGSFIVRLADLNGYLGRLHEDRGPATQRARLEMVVVRDPDGDTQVTTFLDGARFSDIEEYVVDAGRGYTYSDWIESRDDAVEAASPAAAELLRACYDHPPGSSYIGGAPDGWPHDTGEVR